MNVFCSSEYLIKFLLLLIPALSNPEQIKILAKKWSLLTEEMKKVLDLDLSFV